MESHLYNAQKLNKLLVCTNQCVNLQNHMQNVCNLSLKIAKYICLPQNQIKTLSIAALLHDIGKVKIPKGILNKRGKLTEYEMNIVKQHPQIGAEYLKNIGYDNDIFIAVLQHHERIDGTGYPNGIKGKDICLYARIIAIADSYDAMTNLRTYSKPLSKEQAIKELIRCSGTQFDEYLVAVYRNILVDNAKQISI